jgi:hypothetical protein
MVMIARVLDAMAFQQAAERSIGAASVEVMTGCALAVMVSRTVDLLMIYVACVVA